MQNFVKITQAKSSKKAKYEAQSIIKQLTGDRNQ